MVAGVVLVAVALKKTLAEVDDPLTTVTAFALLGGVGFYLLGLVGFRYRHVHTINRHRLLLALALFALFPAAVELPALAVLTIVTAALCVMIAYETISYGEGRARVRHEEELPRRGDSRQSEMKGRDPLLARLLLRQLHLLQLTP